MPPPRSHTISARWTSRSQPHEDLPAAFLRTSSPRILTGGRVLGPPVLQCGERLLGLLDAAHCSGTRIALWASKIHDSRTDPIAIVAPDGLFLRVDVTDDHVTSEDGVRLTSLNDDEIQPESMTRTATTIGYVMGMSWSKSQLRDALGDDSPYWLDPDRGAGDGVAEMEELPVVIEIHDVDNGKPRAVLSSRPIGTPYAAAILIQLAVRPGVEGSIVAC